MFFLCVFFLGGDSFFFGGGVCFCLIVIAELDECERGSTIISIRLYS